MIRAAAALCVAAVGCAGCAMTPAAPATTGAIENHASVRLDQSIRDVDFANRVYTIDWFSEGEMADISMKVVDAAWSQTDDYGGIRETQTLDVGSPMYLDVNHDGIEDAIVHETYCGGGTGHFDAEVVFTMRHGAAVPLGVIPGGDREDGGIIELVTDGPGLKVTRYHPTSGEGACCASELAIEYWRWRGGKLVRDDDRTKIVPNDEVDRP